jgi:hypothetical protein
MTAKLSRCSRRCWDCRSLKITLPNPSGSGLILFIRRLAAREAIFCWNDIQPRQSVDAISERPRRSSRHARVLLPCQSVRRRSGRLPPSADHRRSRRAGAQLGGFDSRVAGIGPQINYFFPVSDKIQGYANVKVCKEFVGLDIAQGLERVWLPIAILPARARKAEGRRLIENPRQEFHHEGRAHSQERADLNR